MANNKYILTRGLGPVGGVEFIPTLGLTPGAAIVITKGLDSDMAEEKNRAVAITPNDSTTFTNHYILYVGATGNIQVDTVGGDSAVLLVGVPAGTILPLRVKRVYSTNTTASSILGFYNS